jgi:DNA uptake protein ComE-like DNA-binding protein
MWTFETAIPVTGLVMLAGCSSYTNQSITDEMASRFGALKREPHWLENNQQRLVRNWKPRSDGMWSLNSKWMIWVGLWKSRYIVRRNTVDQATYIHLDLSVNINSASHDQLRVLNGIGDTYAKRIVEGRPYQSPDELVMRKLIAERTYNKIKGQLIAR